MKQARIKLQLGLLLGGLLGGLQLGPANSLAAQSLVSTNPRQATIKKASTKKATTKKAAVQKTPATAGKAKGDFELVTVGGRATWLSDALRRRWGVNVVPEARQRTLAIEATDGRLFTVVEDRRGRAFRNDPRLLQSNWEFVVRKYRRTQIV